MKNDSNFFSYPVPVIIWIMVFSAIVIGLFSAGAMIEKVRRVNTSARAVRNVRRNRKKKCGESPGGNVDIAIECSSGP